MSDNNKEALAHLPTELKDVAVLARGTPALNSVNTYVARSGSRWPLMTPALSGCSSGRCCLT